MHGVRGWDLLLCQEGDVFPEGVVDAELACPREVRIRFPLWRLVHLGVGLAAPVRARLRIVGRTPAEHHHMIAAAALLPRGCTCEMGFDLRIVRLQRVGRGRTESPLYFVHDVRGRVRDEMHRGQAQVFAG